MWQTAFNRTGKTNTGILRACFLCGILVLSFGLLLLPKSASAQQGAGFRFGASVDPDQFYFGGQFESDPITDQLRFRPTIEIGIGDNRTLIAVNV